MNPIVGDPPAIQWVAIERLVVDTSYQRTADNRRRERSIATIASHWDWRLCQPLMVSNRAGQFFVIDGQHRRIAAERRGDIPHLPCSIFTLESLQDEALLFVAANSTRKTMTPTDRFRGAVVGGDPQAVVIDRLVREAGLSIGVGGGGAVDGKPGQMSNVRGMVRALNSYGAQTVSAALTAIGEAWGDQVLTRPGLLFAAIVNVFRKAPDGFDADLFNRALRSAENDLWTEGLLGKGLAQLPELESAFLGEMRAMAADA